jgi:hypothetical protein
MDDKKLAQAERAIPPPSGTRRTLRSATATQAPSKDTTAPEQKKSHQKALLAAQRTLLDKEGFLKAEEDLTATSPLHRVQANLRQVPRKNALRHTESHASLQGSSCHVRR